MTHLPQRTCVGCRSKAARSELLRFVVVGGSPPQVIPDSLCRLPGRGAYVHLDRRCVQTAERRRAFSRALRVAGPVDVTAVRRYLDDMTEPPAAARGST